MISKLSCVLLKYFLQAIALVKTLIKIAAQITPVLKEFVVTLVISLLHLLNIKTCKMSR